MFWLNISTLKSIFLVTWRRAATASLDQVTLRENFIRINQMIWFIQLEYFVERVGCMHLHSWYVRSGQFKIIVPYTRGRTNFRLFIARRKF